MYLYGVFSGAQWTLLTNKRKALKLARMWGGYVGRTGYHTFAGGLAYGIDAPTFRAFMDVVADYRR